MPDAGRVAIHRLINVLAETVRLDTIRVLASGPATLSEFAMTFGLNTPAIESALRELHEHGLIESRDDQFWLSRNVRVRSDDEFHEFDFRVVARGKFRLTLKKHERSSIGRRNMASS